MTVKRLFIYALIMLMTAYPVSAAEVSLNRWALNVTLHDDGTVDETVQAEIDDSGSMPLDGFSFAVPASGITVIYDFAHTTSFSGLTVDQQPVPGGTIIKHLGRSYQGRKCPYLFLLMRT